MHYKPNSVWLKSVLLILLWVAIISAEASAQSTTQPSGKTLVYCAAAGPETFNPQLTIQQATFDASSRVVYNRLVESKPGSTQVVPALAKSWEITDNGRVYTFKLRAGVKFHNTREFRPSRPFNADDVLFSFVRQWRKNHPYHTVSGDSYDYFNGMGVARIVLAVDKLDNSTVQFTLKQPEASFLAILAMDFASILSAEYGEQLLRQGEPELLDRRPVGTGPFRLLGYETPHRLRYQAHQDYWAGRPALDFLLFDIIPEFAERQDKLKRGLCHLAPPLRQVELSAFRQNQGVRLLRKPALDVAYLAFNTNKPPFDDVRVRRALSLAVDRQAILELVYQSAGVLAQQPLPPLSWAHSDSSTDAPHYDVATAKALLAETGFAEGFRSEIWTLPVRRDYLPDAEQAAKLIRADWALLGVEAEIVNLDWPEFLRRTRKGEHQTLLLGWVGDNGDPDNFLRPLLSCTNVGGSNRAQWCDSEFEELLRQARIVTEPDKRITLYTKAMQRFREQSPWLLLAHSVRFQPVRREVKGFEMDAFGGIDLFAVDIK